MRENREHGLSSAENSKHEPPDDSISRRVVPQLIAILGVSTVLGFTFNAASPVGVRFGEISPDLTPTPTAHTNSIPATLVVAATNRLATLPPAPVPKVERPFIKPLTNPPTTPVVVPQSVQVSNPPSPAVKQFSTVLPTPPAATNPAPTHWAQARPCVEAGQAILVDVRAKGMYDAGHIPGAISLPETSSHEEFTAFLNQHPTNLTLIVYCSSITCSQSARVANRLVTQFHRPSVKYMTGGYLEYQQEQAKNPGGPIP
jgi:rhodanese-related sulfurtransferase